MYIYIYIYKNICVDIDNINFIDQSCKMMKLLSICQTYQAFATYVRHTFERDICHARDVDDYIINHRYTCIYADVYT